MHYMGSKNKLSKELSKIILSDVPENCNYIEPFSGGCNMIDKIYHPNIKEKIANDINEFVIQMFINITENNWEPPENLSENDYKFYREKSKLGISDDINLNSMIAFAGISCSWGAKWFGGFARGNDNKGNPRNLPNEGRNNILKQKDNLHGIKFLSTDYKNLENLINKNTIIYCDPPYGNTTNYKNKFNSKEFWEWCDYIKDKCYKIYISEYEAPDNLKVIWEKNVTVFLDKQKNGYKKSTEKLFTYEL